VDVWQIGVIRASRTSRRPVLSPMNKDSKAQAAQVQTGFMNCSDAHNKLKSTYKAKHENNGIQQDPQSQFHKQTPTVQANSIPQFGTLQRGMTEKLHCTLFWSWSLPDYHWQLKMTTGQLGKQARFKETLASHWMGSVTWSSWILLLNIMPE